MKFTQYSGYMLLERDLLNRLRKDKYSLINFTDLTEDICVFASPGLSNKGQYLDLILQSLTHNTFLVEHVPVGCYIFLVSHIDRKYWEGDVIQFKMIPPKLVLPASSFSIFPSYNFEKYALEGFFMGNKFDKATWFLSPKMEVFFTKIRNNIQTLAYRLLETSKLIPMSQEFCSTFYIFHDIFQVTCFCCINLKFTFDFVSEMPEFSNHEPLKEGIIDGN